MKQKKGEGLLYPKPEDQGIHDLLHSHSASHCNNVYIVIKKSLKKISKNKN